MPLVASNISSHWLLPARSLLLIGQLPYFLIGWMTAIQNRHFVRNFAMSTHTLKISCTKIPHLWATWHSKYTHNFLISWLAESLVHEIPHLCVCYYIKAGADRENQQTHTELDMYRPSTRTWPYCRPPYSNTLCIQQTSVSVHENIPAECSLEIHKQNTNRQLLMSIKHLIFQDEMSLKYCSA